MVNRTTSSQKDFANRVADDAFVEWEEVYPALVMARYAKKLNVCGQKV